MVDLSRTDVGLVALARAAGDEPTDRASDLTSPFVAAFGVTGAAVSSLGDPLGVETLSASDARSARWEEIQLDLGEGPAWQAAASRRAVMEPDLRSAAGEAWPFALSALVAEGLSAVYSFPLSVGTIPIGVLDLYDDTTHTFDLTRTPDVQRMAAMVGRTLLVRGMEQATAQGDAAAAPATFSRREIHQATGMVIAQASVSAADALLMLRSHAYSAGETVDETAQQVLDRTLTFIQPTTPRGGIVP
jgi:hypothetical protein